MARRKKEKEISKNDVKEVVEIKSAPVVVEEEKEEVKKEIKKTIKLTLKELIKEGKVKIFRKDTKMFLDIQLSDSDTLAIYENMMIVIGSERKIKNVELEGVLRFLMRTEILEDGSVIIDPRAKTGNTLVNINQIKFEVEQ